MAEPTPERLGAVRIPLLRLARHGETDYNRRGLIQGHDDRADLTPRGKRQADDLAARVSRRPVGLVATSDLRRARHTAERVAAVTGAPLIVDPALRERSLGVLEGLPAALATPSLTGIEGERVVDLDAEPSGGESLRAFGERVTTLVSSLPDLVSDGGSGDVVLVAHGGTIRLLVAALTEVPVTALPWRPLPNAHLLDLPYRPRARRRCPSPPSLAGGGPAITELAG